MALVVAVTLFVKPGRETEFLKYEEQALKRMLGHGGKLVQRVRCATEAKGSEEPYEFHLLEFPNEASFESFVASGAPFEEERDRALERSVVITGWPLATGSGI